MNHSPDEFLNVTTLRIDGCKISKFSRIVEGFPNLRTLSVCGCAMTDAELTFFACFASLIELDLTDNDDVSQEALDDVLIRSPNLEKLESRHLESLDFLTKNFPRLSRCRDLGEIYASRETLDAIRDLEKKIGRKLPAIFTRA